jgi:hypothetical protein
MMIFRYTILYVDDVAASLDFYERAFAIRRARYAQRFMTWQPTQRRLVEAKLPRLRPNDIGRCRPSAIDGRVLIHQADYRIQGSEGRGAGVVGIAISRHFHAILSFESEHIRSM